MKGGARAVIELRARLLWRRLTGRAGIGEGVARVTLLLVAVPVGLFFAVFLGLGTWQAVRAPGGLRTEVTAVAVYFGIWQTWTAVSLSLNEREGIDLRRFLVYPIPPWRVYALGLGSGLAADPVTLFWGVLLAGIFAGAAIARPGAWLLLLGALLVLFALATALYAALLEEFLALVLSSRRSREWAIVLSVAASVAILLYLAASATRPLQALAEALPALRIARWLAWPGACAAAAARHLYEREPARSLPWLGLLAAGAAGAGRLAFAIALGQARGAGAGAARAGGKGDARLPLPVGGRLGALVEKEWKYLLRHPLARIYAVLVPAVAALVGLGLEPRIPREARDVIRALPLFGLAAYAHVASQAFWLNSLGWERGGARLAYLAPVDGAEVLLAKNAVLYAYSLALFLASSLLVLVPGRPLPSWALPAALALHAGMAPYLYGAGNLVSILNPKAASFAVQRSATVPALSGLVGLGIVSTVGGLFSLPVLVALRLDSPWTLVGGWAALCAVGWIAYARVLSREGALLASRRDALLPAVCGDDA
ncbi:MAG TPA: hypothetical protein VMT17_03160 [Anaeromyxobacteraceae bacterium]|nr:hypothetical protein [Anaeromyxobacteraceae bacterium]